MLLPRIAASCLAAAFLAPCLAPAALAQVWVNAGQDVTLPAERPLTRLAGTAGNLSPLDFWVADGDGASENRLLKWNDFTGLTVVGPLQNSSGRIYGWPSDFELVRGEVFGIETFDRKLYRLDGTTGLCTDAGPALAYSRLFGLAYDYGADKLYAVDNKTRKILQVDRTTATATVVTTLPAQFSDVRGLACRSGDGRLWFCDDATETLQRLDLASLTIEHILDLNDGPDAKVDEIEFYEGQLFCSYRTYDAGTNIWSVQLARIDLEDEVAVPYGPVIHDASAHSLLIHSVPESLVWVQVSGPAATIEQPARLDTPVTLSTPGQYVFELQARLFHRVVVADQVTIRLPPPAAPPRRAGGGASPGPGQTH